MSGPRQRVTATMSLLVLAASVAACGQQTPAATESATPAATSDSPPTTASVSAEAPALEDPKIWVMYSSVDDDAQLFVNAGATAPMATLTVTAPDGRTVQNLRFEDVGKIGQADVTLEGPEPKLADLKKAFPAGTYTFTATTVAGVRLDAPSTLSYDLLAPPVILGPTTGTTGVPVNGLIIRWQPVTGATRIHVEVEPEKAPPEGALANPKFTIDLPASATSIAVPDGWLQTGVQYVFDVKALAPNGSVTVTDATFTTA
ncbi:hypothetical protein [Mycolicibacterium hodleri]|uniref:Fibronectin type-III domain-containing protein n=1 Tax=Mycolicibacterium hodleri TaxID=49897 RepID=A0A502DL42_9MYCO|nr:hypothetical protein [Mycolicibacterium hodleri]TPG26145.1 hypothetical protein EAH80_29665 [Mycolicibacterium hodleri]